MRAIAFAVVAVVLGVVLPAALGAGARAKDCELTDPAADPDKKVCKDIVVSFASTADHAAKADPDELEIPSQHKNVHLYWSLPQGCQFDTNLGDGVFRKSLLPISLQIHQTFATNDKDDKPSSSDRGTRYHWRDRNTSSGTYTYRIWFHCGTDTVRYYADPTIKNQ